MSDDTPMSRAPVEDPIEAIVALALADADIRFIVGRGTGALDFFLPDHDVYVEVKQFYSPRISDQMSRHPNVIAIQGRAAALAFARLISKG